jgi:Type IV secretion system proteins
MRRALLLGAVMTGLWAPVSHAQIPVTDGGLNFQAAKTFLQDLKGYATQLRQLEQAIQQVQWATAEFNSLVANPSLPAAMGLLQAVGIQNPLPVSPYAIQGLISGQGGINGTLGALSSFTSGAATTNRVYTCTDNTFACQNSLASANSVAGSQGIAQQVYAQIAAHFPLMASLQRDMLAATTPAERESVMGQIQAEQAWAQQAQGQLQTAQIMLVAEQDNRVQRDNEKLSQSFHSQLDQARAAGVIR